MKKILILTSVLALAACGGGHHGGETTNDILTPQQREAMGSNAIVTNLNSFIVVGGSNPTVNPNSRAASTHIFSEPNGGTIYDLENVTFKTIPTSGVISDLMFHTDENGKIVSIEFLDAERIMAEHGNSSVLVGELERIDKTNIFIAHPGQINMPQTEDMQIEYISYADEESGLGLKYADFGVLKMDSSKLAGADVDTYYMPFMGGFDAKNIDYDQMKNLAQNSDMVFTGMARGTVIYSDELTDEVESKSLIDNNAKLTFASNGTQTLTADFEDWAKVQAIKAADGTNQFKVDSYVTASSNLYLTDSPAGLVEGEMNEHSMAFQTGYYGDNNAPNEAVGLVQYQHGTDYNDGLHDYEKHINVDFGFGGKN